jgi:hypothetical protein
MNICTWILTEFCICLYRMWKMPLTYVCTYIACLTHQYLQIYQGRRLQPVQRCWHLEFTMSGQTRSKLPLPAWPRWKATASSGTAWPPPGVAISRCLLGHGLANHEAKKAILQHSNLKQMLSIAYSESQSLMYNNQFMYIFVLPTNVLVMFCST